LIRIGKNKSKNVTR